MIDFLKEVKRTGVIPPDHRSHDHLNVQREVPIDEELRNRWIGEFERARDENAEEEHIIWAIVDGFLLYWHPVRGNLILDWDAY